MKICNCSNRYALTDYAVFGEHDVGAALRTRYGHVRRDGYAARRRRRRLKRRGNPRRSAGRGGRQLQQTDGAEGVLTGERPRLVERLDANRTDELLARGLNPRSRPLAGSRIRLTFVIRHPSFYHST